EDQSVEEFLSSSIEAAQKSLLNDATRYSHRKTLDLFWERPTINEAVATEAIAERVAAAFLGVRIECARCHKHPFDRWTQTDYAAFVNLFANVTFGSSTEVNRAILV